MDIKQLYDALGGFYPNIEDTFDINQLGIVDLTDVFATGISSDINTAIKENKTGNILYVAPGDYDLDGPIMLSSVRNFICMGNLIGPEDLTAIKPISEFFTDTVYRDEVVRALVYFMASSANIRINNITVKNNYCGFYAYWSELSNIKIGSIIGEYKTYNQQTGHTLSVYPSRFGNASTAQSTSKQTRYLPIPNDWYLNSGFIGTSMNDCEVDIDYISNLNQGLYFINTIPASAPSGFSGLNIKKVQMQLTRFNVKAIDCKKGVMLDLLHKINLTTSASGYTTTQSNYTGSSSYIHGCDFNINSFNYHGGVNTNSVETINTDFYPDTTVDNRRYMFYLLGRASKNPIGGNMFASQYAQGVYDAVLYAQNVLGCEFRGIVQVNDLFINVNDDVSQRHDPISSTRYLKGTTEGYETSTNVNLGPVVVFNNCTDFKFINIGQDAFRKNNEISVTNSRNIFVNQVIPTNALSDFHSITTSNYNNVKSVIYDNEDTYYKVWNDGYFDSDDNYVSVNTSSSEIVSSTGATQTVTIQPNTKYYDFGEVSSLTVNLGTGVTGRTNTYSFTFTCASDATTLTVPNTVKLAGNLEALNYKTGRTFEVSIMNNIMSYLYVD